MTRRPPRKNEHRIGCAGTFVVFAALMAALFLFDTFGGFAWLNR